MPIIPAKGSFTNNLGIEGVIETFAKFYVVLAGMPSAGKSYIMNAVTEAVCEIEEFLEVPSCESRQMTNDFTLESFNERIENGQKLLGKNILYIEDSNFY